jgi:hypothetical protein
MTTPMTLLRRALVVATWAGASAMAQSPASAPASLPDLPPSAASGPRAPASGPLGPRLRTPAETGKRATAPGDLSPDRPVTPQLTIPFGKNPPPAKPEPRVRRGTTPPPTAGSVDDSAARCEAQQDPQDRATCRAKLAREAKTRLPN